MTRYLCVVSLAAAAVLSDVKTPSTDLEKFEEKMKKKWDSILEKHPIDLASTTDAPEALAAPTALPDEHILDSLRQLDESTAAPTLFAALDDLKVATTAAPTTDDISAELAHLKARLNAESETTVAPLAATAAPIDTSDLLVNLHKHLHDVHSSVHDALEGSLSHPGIKSAVDALSVEPHEDDSSDEDAKGDLSNLMMAPPAEGDEDSKPVAKAETEDDAAGESKIATQKAAAMQGMQRLMGAVKMIVMLQPMLEPLKEKLSLALEHMTEADQAKAKSILNHIKVLGVYSKVTAGLMAGVVAAKQGTAEDREKAIATLIVGVKQIQGKVAKHLLQMKQETLAMEKAPAGSAALAGGEGPEEPEDAEAAEAEGAHAQHAEKAMDKMTALLVKLGKKIAAEIKDPANRHNPKVLLDIKLFLAVKDSVEKTQALMMAGSIAIKKAKTAEEKEAVQAAVKKGMGKVEATLKEKMMALEKQALILAVAAAKQHEAESKGSADDENKGSADEEKPAAGSKKAKDDDDDDKSEESDEDSDDSADDDQSASGASGGSSSGAHGGSSAGSHAGSSPGSHGGSSHGGSSHGGSSTGSADEESESKDDDVDEKKATKAKDDDKKADSAAAEDEEEDTEEDKADDEKEDKAPASPPKKSGLASEEAAAKKNNPGISAGDIEKIFEEAADDATGDSPQSLSEDEVHLRTH